MDIPGYETFLDVIRAALRLEPSVYQAIQTSADGLRIALWVVLFASASSALGQSIVLLVNRVRPHRFFLALAIGAMSHVVGFLLWSVTVWGVSTYIFGAETSIIALGAAVGLAYAPQLLAFFELTPFLGNPFALILTLWSMLAVTIAVDVGTGLLFREAALTSALGWALIQLWKRSIGWPIYALGRWMQRRAAGTALPWTMRDIRTLRRAGNLAANWSKWRERSGSISALQDLVRSEGQVSVDEARERARNRDGGGTA